MHCSVLVIGDDPEVQLEPFLAYQGDYFPSPGGIDLEFEDLELEYESNPKYAKDGTVKQWAEDYHGFTDRDAETGRYGYWFNPKGRYDYYFIGGRWYGFFLLKPGCTGQKGHPSWGTPENELNDNRCSQAYKKAIDWDAMKNAARVKADKEYDNYNTATIPEFTKTECITRYVEEYRMTQSMLYNGEWIEFLEPEQFNEILDSLSEDTLLTIVDTHS